MSENEKDIFEIVEIIFNKPPGDEKSINLYFEDIDLEDLFKNLLMIFTYGMKKIYGNENGIVNLKILNDNQLKIINKYFNMFSIDFFYKIYHEGEYNLMLTEHFQFTDLSILKNHRFKIKSEDLIYVIYFDFKL